MNDLMKRTVCCAKGIKYNISPYTMPVNHTVNRLPSQLFMGVRVAMQGQPDVLGADIVKRIEKVGGKRIEVCPVSTGEKMYTFYLYGTTADEQKEILAAISKLAGKLCPLSK